MLQVLFAGAAVRFDFDKGPSRFAPFRVRRGNNCGQQDFRVLMQHRLNLKARKILAAGNDDVFRAVLNLYLSVRVHHGQIARAEDATAEGRLCSLGIAKIPRHQCVATQGDLSDGGTISRHRHSVGIQNHNRAGGMMPPALPGKLSGPCVSVGFRRKAGCVYRDRAVALGPPIKVHDIET